MTPHRPHTMNDPAAGAGLSQPDSTRQATGAVSWPASLDALAARLVRVLSERGETAATAESLTGGLIGAAITSAAGASAIYRGGVISYATDLKTELVGVEPATLTLHGAVSEQTAAEMASGTAQRCLAHWGIAVTGVAGPASQEGHPPGTVFCGIARSAALSEPAVPEPDASDVAGSNSHQTRVWQFQFAGDRAQVRLAAVEAVLQLLDRACRGRAAGPT